MPSRSRCVPRLVGPGAVEAARGRWGRVAACDQAEPLLRGSFPGGRLACGSRQDGAVQLGARYRCRPLLPGVGHRLRPDAGHSQGCARPAPSRHGAGRPRGLPKTSTSSPATSAAGLATDSGIVGACGARAWKALAAGEDRCCAPAIPRGRRAGPCTTGPWERCTVALGLRAERSAVHDEGNGRVLGC